MVHGGKHLLKWAPKKQPRSFPVRPTLANQIFACQPPFQDTAMWMVPLRHGAFHWVPQACWILDGWCHGKYLLVMTNIAMEHGPFIVNLPNVGYWLVWGYTIVSTDLKIILLLWKCSRGTLLCPQDFGVSFFSFFCFLVFNCFLFYFKILKYFLFLFLIIIIFNLIIF